MKLAEFNYSKHTDLNNDEIAMILYNLYSTVLKTKRLFEFPRVRRDSNFGLIKRQDNYMIDKLLKGESVLVLSESIKVINNVTMLTITEVNKALDEFMAKGNNIYGLICNEEILMEEFYTLIYLELVRKYKKINNGGNKQ